MEENVKVASDYEELEDLFNNGKVGDLIDFVMGNQEGLIHYKIIEKDGVKELKKIGDYDSDMAAQMSSKCGRRKNQNEEEVQNEEEFQNVNKIKLILI